MTGVCGPAAAYRSTHMRYTDCMPVIFKFGFALSTVLFSSLLLIVGLLIAVMATFATPTHIKQGIEESGAYSAFVGAILDDAAAGPLHTLPLDDPDLRAIFIEAMEPAVQASTEEGVDSLYGWLRGGDLPSMHLDLAAIQTPIADGAEEYTRAYLSELPDCPAQSSQPTHNPLTLSCLPQDLEVSAATQQVRQTILNETDNWEMPALTLEDFREDGLDDDMQAVANTYRATVASFWILLVATLLAGTATVLLAARLSAGLSTAGSISIMTGGLLLLIAWGASVLLGNFAADTTANDNPMAAAAPELVQYLGNTLRSWWLWTGIILALTGSALVSGAIIAKRRSRR